MKALAGRVGTIIVFMHYSICGFFTVLASELIVCWHTTISDLSCVLDFQHRKGPGDFPFCLPFEVSFYCFSVDHSNAFRALHEVFLQAIPSLWQYAHL